MPMKRKMAPAAPKKDFVKLVDGFISTIWSKASEIVRLTEAQAKYPLLNGSGKRK